MGQKVAEKKLRLRSYPSFVEDALKYVDNDGYLTETGNEVWAWLRKNEKKAKLEEIKYIIKTSSGFIDVRDYGWDIKCIDGKYYYVRGKEKIEITAENLKDRNVLEKVKTEIKPEKEKEIEKTKREEKPASQEPDVVERKLEEIVPIATAIAYALTGVGRYSKAYGKSAQDYFSQEVRNLLCEYAAIDCTGLTNKQLRDHLLKYKGDGARWLTKFAKIFPIELYNVTLRELSNRLRSLNQRLRELEQRFTAAGTEEVGREIHSQMDKLLTNNYEYANLLLWLRYDGYFKPADGNFVRAYLKAIDPKNIDFRWRNKLARTYGAHAVFTRGKLDALSYVVLVKNINEEVMQKVRYMYLVKQEGGNYKIHLDPARAQSLFWEEVARMVDASTDVVTLGPSAVGLVLYFDKILPSMVRTFRNIETIKNIDNGLILLNTSAFSKYGFESEAINYLYSEVARRIERHSVDLITRTLTAVSPLYSILDAASQYDPKRATGFNWALKLLKDNYERFAEGTYTYTDFITTLSDKLSEAGINPQDFLRMRTAGGKTVGQVLQEIFNPESVEIVGEVYYVPLSVFDEFMGGLHYEFTDIELPPEYGFFEAVGFTDWYIGGAGAAGTEEYNYTTINVEAFGPSKYYSLSKMTSESSGGLRLLIQDANMFGGRAYMYGDYTVTFVGSAVNKNLNAALDWASHGARVVITADVSRTRETTFYNFYVYYKDKRTNSWYRIVKYRFSDIRKLLLTARWNRVLVEWLNANRDGIRAPFALFAIQPSDRLTLGYMFGLEEEDFNKFISGQLSEEEVKEKQVHFAFFSYLTDPHAIGSGIKDYDFYYGGVIWGGERGFVTGWQRVREGNKLALRALRTRQGHYYEFSKQSAKVHIHINAIKYLDKYIYSSGFLSRISKHKELLVLLMAFQNDPRLRWHSVVKFKDTELDEAWTNLVQITYTSYVMNQGYSSLAMQGYEMALSALQRMRNILEENKQRLMGVAENLGAQQEMEWIRNGQYGLLQTTERGREILQQAALELSEEQKQDLLRAMTELDYGLREMRSFWLLFQGKTLASLKMEGLRGGFELVYSGYSDSTALWLANAYVPLSEGELGIRVGAGKVEVGGEVEKLSIVGGKVVIPLSEALWMAQYYNVKAGSFGITYAALGRQERTWTLLGEYLKQALNRDDTYFNRKMYGIWYLLHKNGLVGERRVWMIGLHKITDEANFYELKKTRITAGYEKVIYGEPASGTFTLISGQVIYGWGDFIPLLSSSVEKYKELGVALKFTLTKPDVTYFGTLYYGKMGLGGAKIDRFIWHAGMKRSIGYVWVL